MGTKGTPASSVAIAVAFALSVFCLGLFVWVSFGGGVPLGAKGYRVTVQLGPEATNVFPNAQVRAAGVDVGRVKRVQSSEGRVDVEVELQSRYAPLREGTRAILRSKTLLGEAYVEVAPGPRGARAIPEGGRLAPGDVQAAQTVDGALSVFDARGRRDFRRFLEGVAGATDGRAPDLNAALGNAPLATADLRRLVDVLDRQSTPLGQLVRSTGVTLRSVADRGASVQQLARASSAVLATTAGRQADLTATVRELPRFMASLRRFSGATVRLSRTTAPAVRTLRPVAGLLEPGLRAGRQLAPDLAATLTALDGTITRSRTAVPALTAVVRGAAPLLQAVDPAGRELVPVLRVLAAYRNDAIASMANTAAATQATLPRPGGTPKHYLRADILVNDEFGFGATTRQGTHRENAYLPPGGVGSMIAGKPFASISCGEAKGDPPCLQQTPYALAGGPAGIVPRVPSDGSRP